MRPCTRIATGSVGCMPVPATAVEWMLAQCSSEQAAWLGQASAAISTAGLGSAAAERALGMAYAQCARRFPRTPFCHPAGKLIPPSNLRPGWQPQRWTWDQVARAVLLAQLPAHNESALVAAVDALAARADGRELIALYQALPVLPGPTLWRDRAAEGVRSNMRPVFAAVALDNPYPAEQLDDERWNQLVLKALFLEAPTHRIHGLSARANPVLAQMLGQYARERWAAGRRIPPGLWRGVAAHADPERVADLRRALGDPDPRTRTAARLAVQESAPALLPTLDPSGPPTHATWATLEAPDC